MTGLKDVKWMKNGVNWIESHEENWYKFLQTVK